MAFNFTLKANKSEIASTFTPNWSGIAKLYYRAAKSGDDWVELPKNTTIPVTTKGLEFTSTDIRTHENAHFNMTGSISASGSLASLVTDIGETGTLNECQFSFMFYNCKALTTAPELPFKNLAKECYIAMFYECYGLLIAPALRATTLVNGCYHSMFRNCKSLSKVFALPATKMEPYCYFYMFSGCTSLSSAPALPATELAEYCYDSMFFGCTVLSRPPAELPAKNLVRYCYRYMFKRCKSLITIPKMMVDTTTNCCCYEMFMECSLLRGYTNPITGYAVKLNIASITGTDTLYQMFKSINRSGTMPTTPLAGINYYFFELGDEPEIEAEKVTSYLNFKYN